MAGVPIQRANLKLWPEKGLSHTDQTAVSSWTQQIRWEAGWCATYLPRGAILIETFNKVLSKDSGSHRFYFWPIICFNTSRMRVYFMFEVVSSVVVKDAIWRKGPGLILRPNPGCTSVIHGRIWSQKDSRSLIPENRFFGWNFYPMKMMNSMSFLTCTPDSFPGMTELHAGYDSYLYQDTPLLLQLWPISVKQLQQLWDKFRMLILPFFFDTHPTLWATIQRSSGV